MHPIDDPASPAWLTGLAGEGAAIDAVLSGGTSRQTVAITTPDGRQLIARRDDGTGPFSGTPFTLAREAAACRWAAASGLPAPGVAAISHDGSAYTATHLPGRAARHDEALDDYLAVLARLHREDPDGFPRLSPPSDHGGEPDDLPVWRDLVTTRLEPAEPVLDLALDTLARHRTSWADQQVVCHGDTGAGNYLVDGDRVTGLVDWELAHLGDPHHDLASIAVRATLLGRPIPDLVDRIHTHYVPRAPIAFDRDRFRLAAVGVLTRMVISCRCALTAPPTPDRVTQLIGLPLMEVLLVRGIAALDGRPLAARPDITPDPAYAARIVTFVAAGLDERDRSAPRLRYAADQLAAALAASPSVDAAVAPAGDPATGLDAAWVAARGRLAALPASRTIADSPVIGAW